MKNLSWNLPYWARLLGYDLEGGSGTFDDMYLYKNHKIVKHWNYMDDIPNIFEMEDIILGAESQEIMQGSKITY